MLLWLKVQNRLRREEGQDLTEYALLLGLIALICIAAVTTLGTKVRDVLTQIAGGLP
jgi:Flp pilus assembly pilin Flp